MKTAAFLSILSAAATLFLLTSSANANSAIAVTVAEVTPALP